MEVAFRADASLQIGTGHVIRCLTLADALRERGANCRFVCRAHDGHLARTIEARGYAVSLLSPVHGLDSVGRQEHHTVRHERWLGADWQTDAAQTIAALAGSAPHDWLIVDHYALDERWEGLLRSTSRRLMVIDDLADRVHNCDVLLDQNLGRQESDYLRFLPQACTKLIGPMYALLRPEFARCRVESLSRRLVPELKRVLVSLGGIDENNVTGRVLRALRSSDLPADCRLTIVMGPKAPWLDAVRRQAAALPWSAEVLVDVSDMARLMTDSDLSIGAGGGTTWERCCLGLPTVMIVLAENQRAAALAMQDAHAAICLDCSKGFVKRLLRCLREARMSTVQLTSNSSGIVDGIGTKRVTGWMTGHYCGRNIAD
ncbi:UDP-2,4-diacetamido-2,4,6-trideoxy-beta-L-altropyranose hydrolase [Castellaniella sp. UC4442_H9]